MSNCQREVTGLDTGLERDTISPCEPSRHINISCSSFVFAWSSLSLLISFLSMATSSKVQPLVYLILSLEEQCFFRDAPSSAAHFRPLCYSWCFKLLSLRHVFSILTLPTRLFWDDFPYASYVSFTSLSYFVWVPPSLPLYSQHSQACSGGETLGIWCLFLYLQEIWRSWDSLYSSNVEGVVHVWVICTPWWFHVWEIDV